MVEDTKAVVKDALDAANDTFTKTDGGFPCGFAMVKGLDGRRKETKIAKEVDGLTVDSDNYHGTTLSINSFGGQWMQPKASGYREFLRVCQENGLFKDARLWTYMD